MSKFTDQVYKVIQGIPYGKVMSYGQVALYAGSPRAARQVGWILHQSEGQVELPWWRVINNAGRISIKGSYENTPNVQKQLLESEGVFVEENLDIDIEKYRWISQNNTMTVENKPGHLTSVPEPVRKFIYETRQARRLSSTELKTMNPTAAESLQKIYDYEDRFVDDSALYTAGVFRTMHFSQYPDTSIGGLAITDETLGNILRTTTEDDWHVPALAEKISLGQFTTDDLLPQAAQADQENQFKKLEEAIQNWYNKYGYNPSS